MLKYEYKKCGKNYVKTTFRPRLFTNLMGRFDVLLTTEDTPNRMMGRIVKDSIEHIEDYRNIPPVNDMDEKGLKVQFMGWFLEDKVVGDSTKNELGHIEYAMMTSLKNSFYGIYRNKYNTFIIYYETNGVSEHEFYIVEAEIFRIPNDNIPEIVANESFPVFRKMDIEDAVYNHKMIMEGDFKKPAKTYPNKPKEKIVYQPLNYVLSDLYDNVLKDLLEPIRNASSVYSNISPLKSMLPLSTNEAECILSKYGKSADSSSRYYLIFSNIILDEDVPRDMSTPMSLNPYTYTWMVLEISSYRDTKGRKLHNYFIYSIKQMGGIKLETNPIFIVIG